MITRLRKTSSRGESAAISRHSPLVSNRGVIAYPRSSSDPAISCQSIGSTTGFALGCRLIGRLRRDCGALPREQRALAFQSPAIAAEIAVAADHPVARHEQGELVRGAGLSDGTNRFWLAERRSDLGIARGFA